MRICNSPEIFQEKMSELSDGLDIVRVYIDDILYGTNGSIRFLGMINFYGGIWSQRAFLLTPLLALTSVKVPYK